MDKTKKDIVLFEICENKKGIVYIKKISKDNLKYIEEIDEEEV